MVVCALQPEYPLEVQAILQELEIIPTVKIAKSESIDVPAVIRRHPQVALIDGLAYENPPGSPNAHRWQDVGQLLDAGISVIATVNLQYLEKLQDELERITGNRASCTIPSGFLDRTADEIAVVDAPARDCLGREPITGDRASVLVEGNKLSRLRELALLVAASVVDRQLESYLRSHGMDQSWGVQERILVCVSPRSNAKRMLESGRRNADRFQGEFYVVYIQERALSREDELILKQNLDYARELGAEVEILSGFGNAETILRFAKQKGISQIFVGHGTRDGVQARIWGSVVDRLIRSAEGIDVVVYPTEGQSVNAGEVLAIVNSADLITDRSRTPRGQLQVFLGYAAGVGKTYRMLEEAQQLKRQGKDIVIGYFEPHGRKDTIARTAGLEMIPAKTISYRGVMLQEMDIEAILKRRPATCVVDELAHTNVPGSERSKRWEDVQALLDAGIDVMTNMNIQHLESLNDHIFHITGVRVRETVPDWFVKGADEVVMVDATTEALLNRLKGSRLYTRKSPTALENFFKESTLTALRELALGRQPMS